jgi:lysophospholipase L1-like esterase
MRFLSLGDSYTIGESVPPDQRWPVQLAAWLRKEGAAIDEPQIIATTGWTTDELWAGMDRAAPRGPFELVSLLIGVNNQYRGRPVAEYQTQFDALLGRAIQLAGAQARRVLVLSIPDWGVTPFARSRDPAAIGRDIDEFNAANARAARLAGAQYVDVTPVSRLAATDAALIAGDGLHPSGKMYAEWARLALPAAREGIGA